MKFIFTFIFVIVLFISNLCFANPFIVCDSQKGVTDYHITGLTKDVISVPAVKDSDNTGHLEYDLKGLAIGTYDCNVTAYNSLWDLESPPSPFQFSKPSMESPSVIQIIVR